MQADWFVRDYSYLTLYVQLINIIGAFDLLKYSQLEMYTCMDSSSFLASMKYLLHKNKLHPCTKSETDPGEVDGPGG